MWQSSGKFQPRKDQLERIAPVISRWDVSRVWKPTAVPLNR